MSDTERLEAAAAALEQRPWTLWDDEFRAVAALLRHVAVTLTPYTSATYPPRVAALAVADAVLGVPAAEEPLCQCSRPDLPSPHRAHSADWDRACPSLPDAEWTAMHDRHAAIGWRCLQCPRPATPKEQK